MEGGESGSLAVAAQPQIKATHYESIKPLCARGELERLSVHARDESYLVYSRASSPFGRMEMRCIAERYS